jgi:drug/metabolite transporter (DMT)-like permease
VPAIALALTLAAALVHAAWNLLLADAEDTLAAGAVAVALGAVMFAPAAAITWHLTTAALPYMAASAALESLYLVLLANAYARAAIGFVYPIARGTAPVLVLIIGALALGTRIAAAQVLGVLLVAAGIMVVRGLNGPESPRDLVLATATGACIAGYTLIDKRGLAHAGPLSYLEVVFVLTALANLAGTWRARGGARIRAAAGARTLAAGAGFFGSYALVLAALRLAPAASVAATRECSVVIAAAYLGLTHREPAGPRRLAGAVAVAGGIALVALA